MYLYKNIQKNINSITFKGQNCLKIFNKLTGMCFLQCSKLIILTTTTQKSYLEYSKYKSLKKLKVNPLQIVLPSKKNFPRLKILGFPQFNIDIVNREIMNQIEELRISKNNIFTRFTLFDLPCYFLKMKKLQKLKLVGHVNFESLKNICTNSFNFLQVDCIHTEFQISNFFKKTQSIKTLTLKIANNFIGSLNELYKFENLTKLKLQYCKFLKSGSQLNIKYEIKKQIEFFFGNHPYDFKYYCKVEFDFKFKSNLFLKKYVMSTEIINFFLTCIKKNTELSQVDVDCSNYFNIIKPFCDLKSQVLWRRNSKKVEKV